MSAALSAPTAAAADPLRPFAAAGRWRRSSTCLFCRQPREVAVTPALRAARVYSPCSRCRLRKGAR